jgi:hypothetical protein
MARHKFYDIGGYVLEYAVDIAPRKDDHGDRQGDADARDQAAPGITEKIPER